MSINTLYQLQSDYAARPELMDAARNLLFIPDLLSFFLSGEKVTEYTIASTSQLLNAHTRKWDDATFAGALPEAARSLAGEITAPCTVIGGLSRAVLAETGINSDCRVVAVGGHDTASAVAATPLSNERSAYLSCGTWSLLGMELDAPRVTEKSRELNFTNEGGLDGKIRYLKNINGLWMIQQLRKSQGSRFTFAELSRMAEEAERTHFTIEPNDASFANPADMYAAVRDFCAAHGQGEIETLGEAAAAIYNGLTREYADVITQLENVLETKIDTLHIVGGGIQDKFLCGQTAKRIGRTVIAGPVEASALGNILAQMIGLGAITNLNEGRDIIRRSFTPEIYA
jgi:rhamnulokinase